MIVRYIDLFCGIGGFRLGAEAAFRDRNIKGKCVFSSDIDADAQRAYEANFGERPTGDIKKVNASDVPDHDLLLAGFPCQPFSIMGDSKGFEDTRGTLFFDIARILKAKKPAAFVLENVKQLATHDEGRTLSRVLGTLDSLGYHHTHRVLNALNFGLPQKRERVFIVGFREPTSFSWPLSPIEMTPLTAILETNVPEHFYASERIRQSRLEQCVPTSEPTIWHENKAGHISAYPYSCALRAGASYNYLLVNGERRLTPREMLRLQGFPDTFNIIGNVGQVRKQCGNAVPVPVVKAVVDRVANAMEWDTRPTLYLDAQRHQYVMAIEKRGQYGQP